MRELHGVVKIPDDDALPSLKHKALIFDKLHVIPSFELISNFSGNGTSDGGSVALHAFDQRTEVEIDFLRNQGLVEIIPKLIIDEAMQADRDREPPLVSPEILQIGGTTFIFENDEQANRSASDWYVRTVSARLTDALGVDTVPICDSAIPEYFSKSTHPNSDQTVLSIAMELIPMPSDHCPWEDILLFKAELRQKQWDFRRFMSLLSTKSRTEGEIRDEIDWLVNEYAKAMEIHHIKASHSFVDVFVITPLEIIENLLKLNWSKIAKGALNVKKRKVELLEAEMKAPGRECAYVFDARKRFGAK